MKLVCVYLLLISLCSDSFSFRGHMLNSKYGPNIQMKCGPPLAKMCHSWFMWVVLGWCVHAVARLWPKSGKQERTTKCYLSTWLNVSGLGQIWATVILQSGRPLRKYLACRCFTSLLIIVYVYCLMLWVVFFLQLCSWKQLPAMKTMRLNQNTKVGTCKTKTMGWKTLKFSTERREMAKSDD